MSLASGERRDRMQSLARDRVRSVAASSTNGNGNGNGNAASEAAARRAASRKTVRGLGAAAPGGYLT
jgi:hypothetical protein